VVKRAGLFFILMFALAGAALDGSRAAWAGEATVAPVPFDWSGFYLGYHSGAALDLAETSDPSGGSIFGGTVRTPGAIGGGQVGYNWQSGAFVYGIEANLDWADLQGTNTCFAYSGYYVSSNCRVRVDALGTLTGRLGLVLPFDRATLVYGKAGLAGMYGKIDAKPGGGLGYAASNERGTQWGWTVGAGLERAIAPQWTLKAEYDFLSFDQGFGVPASGYQLVPPDGAFLPTPGVHSSISQDISQFELGVNYKFGVAAPNEMPILPHFQWQGGGYRLTTGIRYVYGWGQFHKDLGLEGEGTSGLASRLTYGNNSTHGWEGTGRLDTPYGVMVKGLIGFSGSGGTLNDEDWNLSSDRPPAATIPYSNTISSVDNDVRYGLVDIGYVAWHGSRYSVSPFAGYTEFRQDMKGFGCRQIANPNSDCGTPIPESQLGIIEDDVWQGLRLGTAVDLSLTRRISFNGDFAYLPYVQFRGTDDHVLRDLVSPEKGDGVGFQLEATLSYALTDAFSLGVGGRYWSMWTRTGDVNFGGQGPIIPMRYASEQADVMVQATYRFGAKPSDASR
jgi:opacity protein-like surface antigen